MTKNDDIFGFMKDKAKITGDVEHSVPTEDWNKSSIEEVFEQLDKAGLPNDVLQTEFDRDRRLPQERPELDKMLDVLGSGPDQDRDGTERDSMPTQGEDGLGCDDSDEPRTTGKSALDLFNEACKAADRERQQTNGESTQSDRTETQNEP